MNYSKYRFNLDMQSYISQISLPVRQNDTGIVLRINLTDGGVPYTIKDGCMAVFFAKNYILLGMVDFISKIAYNTLV